MSGLAPAVNVFERNLRQALVRQGFAPPTGTEVCVVLFDATHSADRAAEAAGLLDAAEGHRAARFRFARDHTAYVLAHAFWRTVLGTCLECPGKRVPLGATASGQPRLPGTGLSSSLSHSDHWVTMAVTRQATVGIDIEPFPSGVPLDDLVARFCTPGETAALATLSSPQLAWAALSLWTRKEALLKAWGTGLRTDPATFSAPTGSPIASPACGDDAPVCHVRDLTLPAPLVGALATPRPEGPDRLYAVDVPTIG